MDPEPDETQATETTTNEFADIRASVETSKNLAGELKELLNELERKFNEQKERLEETEAELARFEELGTTSGNIARAIREVLDREPDIRLREKFHRLAEGLEKLGRWDDVPITMEELRLLVI